MTVPSTRSSRSHAVAFLWVDHDNHRWVTPVAVVCAMAAVAMAGLGLPPVDLHGPLHYLGVMGPLCGMTRAVRHFARLELITALRYNPAVVVVFAAGVAVLIRWAYGRYTGRWLDVRVSWNAPVVLVVAVLVVALTLRQQANVDLLK